MNGFSFFFENQSLRQTILKNTFWLTVANVAGRAIRALLVIYAARALGVAGFGVFSYSLGFAAFLIGLSEIGINGIINRDIARRTGQEGKIISTSFFIKLALSIITYAVILFSASYFVTIPAAIAVVPIIGIALILDGFQQFCFGIIRAFQKMEIEAFVTISSQIASVVLGLLILIVWPTPIGLAIAYAIGSFLAFLFVLYQLKDYFQNLKLNFDWSLVKSILHDSWPFGLISLGNTLLLYTDTIFLGWLKTDIAVGYYSAAIKPIQIIGLIPNLFVIALFPTIARQIAVSGFAKSIIEKGFALMMLFALPIAIGGFLLPEIAILPLFGQKYNDSIPIFQLLILMSIYNFPGAIFGYTLLAHNKQIKAVKYLLGSAFLNIFLNYFFIQRFGVIGAALATVISQSISTLGPMIETWRLEKIFILRHLWRPIIATSGMSFFIFFMKLAGISYWVTFPFSILIYTVILALLREPFFRELILLIKKGRSRLASNN